MRDVDLPDPDALPRVITRAEACARGLSRHAIDRRVATGRWRRLLPATYLTSDTLTWIDRVRAALAYSGDGALVSGAAALSLSGLPRIVRPKRILVLVPPSNRTRSHHFVQVRRTFRPLDRELWAGPARVCPARAAADHALDLDRLDDVRALVAKVVRHGLCTLADLAVELDAGPRNGSAHLRQAIAEVAGGAASAPEARAARVLRRANIRGFVQNTSILLPGGSLYVADLYWPESRGILEIDSAEYHLEPADWRATMDRHLALTSAGYSVIHRPPSALRDEARFVRDVRDWLAGLSARRTA